MCNRYRTGRNACQSEIPADARESFHEIGLGLKEFVDIHPTDGAPVLAIGRAGTPVTVMMRWGWKRDFNQALTLARAENLKGSMWSDGKRCLVPMTGFYETHKLDRSPWQIQQDRPTHSASFFAAGIWEKAADGALCFALVTIPAAAPVSEIHDRQLAPLLGWKEGAEWLSGKRAPLTASRLVYHAENIDLHGKLRFESGIPRPESPV